MSDPIVDFINRLRADVDSLLERELPNQNLSTGNSPTFASITATTGLNLGGGTGATTGKVVARAVAQDAIQTVSDQGALNASAQSKSYLIRVRAANANPLVLFRTDAGAGTDPTLGFAVGSDTAALSIVPGNAVAISTSLAITGGFGCNAATIQTAFASGGALAAYAAGANGLGTGANMAALHALVVAIRAALVANGIMS